MKPLRITNSITDRSTDNVNRYFQEVNKFPVLTVEEETLLATKMKDGDEGAKQKLINSNLRFVVSVAKQFQKQGLSFEDLINEGNLGLIKAANLFDVEKGFKFISYAVWWIRQSIIHGISHTGRNVRLPSNKIDSLIKINKIISKLEQKLERLPTPDEISDVLGKDSVKIMSVKTSEESLDTPISNEDGAITMIELLSSDHDNTLEKRELSIKVLETLGTLDPIERRVLQMYFGVGVDQVYRLEDIGDLMGKTGERIRQIKDRALKKLRYNKNVHTLKTYRL